MEREKKREGKEGIRGKGERKMREEEGRVEEKRMVGKREEATFLFPS